jgi:hypothetical protein
MNFFRKSQFWSLPFPKFLVVVLIAILGYGAIVYAAAPVGGMHQAQP